MKITTLLYTEGYNKHKLHSEALYSLYSFWPLSTHNLGTIQSLWWPCPSRL